MPQFGKVSEQKIATLHTDLQIILREAIKITDFSVICGLRNEIDQNKAVSDRCSKAEYPKSRHNRSKNVDGTYNFTISDAVDIAPYPIKWPNIQTQTTQTYVKRMGVFYRLAGVILTIAALRGIKIRWGGDFKSFFDGPHFERVIT